MSYGKDYWKGMKEVDEEGMREERCVGGRTIYSEVEGQEVVFKGKPWWTNEYGRSP